MDCNYTETKHNPLVTLITPGWNGKQFVHRLLDSIIAQTYRPIQYIYVDDCSTDGTIDVIESYRQKFEEAGIDFTLIRHEKNKGLSETVMTGLQSARGEFFSNPEYDDILMPTSVEKKVRYMQEHSDCGAVVAQAWCVYDNDLEDRSRLIATNSNRFETKHFMSCLTSQTVFNAACMLIRTSAYDKTHPNRRFYASRFGPNQQILLPIYYHYDHGFIDEPLSLFVERSESISHSGNKTLQQNLDSIEEYRQIRERTLRTIDMSVTELQKYIGIVERLVNRNWVVLGFQYQDEELLDRGYQYLENNNLLDEEVRRLHKLMHSFIHYNLYRLKCWIRK